MMAVAPGSPSAEARRAAIRADAAAIGIDEVYVDRFVEAFYAHVRADAALGPIFERAIGVARAYGPTQGLLGLGGAEYRSLLRQARPGSPSP
jgi:hypothetical protein